MAAERLRVICFGMGAIGTYIGGSLASKGAEVVFIEKEELISSIAGNGILLHLPEQEISIPKVELASDVKKLLSERTFDIALLAVKSFDTESVLERLAGIENHFPPILCLQNGVENEDKIASVLSANKVIAGSITSAVGKSAPGEIRLEKLRGVGIETGHPLSETLIDWFNLAGLHAKGYPSRGNMKWSKMLTNLLANATSAILDWSPQQILSNSMTYRIEIAQIREALAVMRALGYKVVDLPGTPVVPLMSLMNSFPAGLSRVLVGPPLARGRGAKMPSFHIDLYSGKTTSEVTFLNGAVARIGKSLNIETPVNQVLTSTLEGLASGKLLKEDFIHKPEKLFQLIKDTV